MSYPDTQHSLQDAMNMMEMLRKKCTDRMGWGQLYRAQRYLMDPKGYEAEILRRNRQCPELGLSEFVLIVEGASMEGTVKKVIRDRGLPSIPSIV